MAQLDSDIFLKQSGVDLGNIADGFERGMRIGDLVRQRKAQEIEMQKQNELKEAYNSGYETKEDGTVVLNPMKVSEFLRSKGRAQDAFKFEQDFKQQQAANLKSDLDGQYTKNSMISSLLDTVKDQDSYLKAKTYAISKGIKEAEQLPNTYDPQIMSSLRAQYQKASLTPLQQIEDSRKREEAQARLAELQDRRLERRDLLNQRNEEKQMALQTPYGLANTPDDAKQLKSADEEKKNFDEKIVELVNLRKKYEGGNLPGINKKDQARSEQLSKDLLLSYKNMAKLGVLSQSDEAIINAIIPEDPLRMRGLAEVIQGEDAILNNLQKFKSDSDKDFANKVQNRVRGGGNYQPQQEKPQPSQQDVQAFEWAKQNPNDPRAAKIIEGLKARGF